MLMSAHRTSQRPAIFTWNANILSCGAFGSGWTVSTHLIFSRSTDPLRPFRFCLSDGETVRELWGRTCVDRNQTWLEENMDSHGTNHFVGIIVIVGYFFLGENEPPLLVVERRGLLLLLGPFDEELFQDAV